MAHVFISYKREDKDFALQLKTQLMGAGFEVWIDENIPPGRKWREEIDGKLRASYALALIVTPKSIKSEYVNYEWTFALGVGAEIVPIYFKEIEKFPYRLDDFQYVDFREGPDYEKLFERLREIREDHRWYIVIPYDAPHNVLEGLEGLNSHVRESRIAAAKHLGNIGNSIAVPGLIERLNDTDLNVRMTVATSLGQIGDQIAVKPLFDALTEYHQNGGESDPVMDRTFDKIVENVLIQLGSKAVEIMILGLVHDLAIVRQSAAYVLGRIQDKSAINTLIKTLNDPEWEVRNRAVWALGQTRDKDAIDALSNVLENDPNQSVRLESAHALGVIGDTKAIEVLFHVLQNHSENVSVRSTAANAIGEIGDKTVVPYMVEVLRTESDASIGINILRSLRQLVSDNHLDLLMDVLRHSSEFPLSQYTQSLLLDLVISIGTTESRAAIEQWQREQYGGQT